MRAGKITLDQALGSFDYASELIGDDEPESGAHAILEIALAHGISAYDAEYVAAARDLGVRVVSADTALAKVVPETVVSLEDFVAGG